MKIKIKKLNEKAIIPQYATEQSAGVDLCSCEYNTVPPGSWTLISTGLSIELPVGYEAQIRPRSGLAAKKGITVLNSPGTIDADYRGEIKVILYNSGVDEFIVNQGDRIAQMVIAKCEQANFEESRELSETDRGDGGFGSTGTS